ncbi:MAG: AlpA family phage regulatory protein [Methylococcales bacterium]
MNKPFSDNMRDIADSMGISLYQRFSENEAMLFLRCSAPDLKKLIKRRVISFIQVTENQVDFFGYQLLEHLLNNINEKDQSNLNIKEAVSERIVRSKELYKITGLSRTTIWRLERANKFPARVSISTANVGWLYTEIIEWMQTRGE